MELPKAYEPKTVESKIYTLWEEGGFFAPEAHPPLEDNPNKNKSFTIVLPPPNITGSLHMGHALNAVIQDILVRQKRMQGYRTLWLPGTDHAGIAAQNVVEKELKKDGLTRFDLGREKFLERMWTWKEKYGNTILDQLKKMGSSCDWSRTRFTMDPKYAKAVETAFLHYYKKGWIYRDKRVINWCPRCKTSLSDLELEYKQEAGKLWYIRYPLAKPKKKVEFITVATTRPETLLGDAAVAVNPRDVRYKNFAGEKIILPIANREIPIVADILVDQKFGTGAVKVTPAHDLTDYEIGLRHQLPALQVIDENGRMTKDTPLPYQELKTLEARQKIVADLKEQGLLEKTEDYSHQVPNCYRCGTVIELIPSWQWFLKMDRLAQMAIRAVKSGRVRFVPKRWEKIYLSWLNSVRDWCVSRQIWWGHKIPIEGENDVLDTWFSSALWPFAVLGWPEQTQDLKQFYPTQVLSTDRGIINLWVARMIFSGMEFMKKEPFGTVYIHATILTNEGKRMSKSLGTGIDPLVFIEKYGADATRFGLAWQMTDLQDIKFGEDNIIMGKKFCNKIWNASRFVLLQLANYKLKIPDKLNISSSKLTGADKKMLKELAATAKSVNQNLEKMQFGKAAQKLYDFFWHDFCDTYIESAKLQMEQPALHDATATILLRILLDSLKLLHPFLPFITEEIYQQLPILRKEKCLMVESWPRP